MDQKCAERVAMKIKDQPGTKEKDGDRSWLTSLVPEGKRKKALRQGWRWGFGRAGWRTAWEYHMG